MSSEPLSDGDRSAPGRAGPPSPKNSLPAAQRQSRIRGLVLVVAAVIAAIAAGSGIYSSRYDAGYKDATRAADTELESVTDEMNVKLTNAKGQIREAASDTQAARRAQREAEDTASSALAYASSLRQQYDPAIQAELLAAVDGEIARACDEAKRNIDAPIDGLVNHFPAWEPVATKDQIVQRVTDCAASERSKTAEQRRAEELAGCGSIPADTLEKDPGAAKGKCLVVYAAVVQFDVNTGKCTFHGNFDSTSHEYSYEYPVRAEFNAPDQLNCPELDPVDSDDLVKVWVTGTGVRSYSTALGGSNAIPQFTIEKIELRAKK